MRSRTFEFSRACLLVLTAACVMSACTQGSSSAGSPSGSQSGTAPAVLPPGTEWAAWINRDIQIDLQNLPQTYTCDELWYKLRAILLAIGAREYMSIDRFHCGNSAPDGGRSPTVHLRFLTLRPVTGDQIRWANTSAMERPVVLAPGTPSRLEPGDCALVQQLRGTLVAYLELPVTTARFECSAPSPHDFELSARVLKRWPKTPADQ